MTSGCSSGISDMLGATSVAKVPMIHAVLPSTFLASDIENVTIVQDQPTLKSLLADSFSYYLYK